MTFVRRNVYLFIASVSYLSLECKLTHEELSLENRIDRHKEMNNIHLVLLFFNFNLNLIVREAEALRNWSRFARLHLCTSTRYLELLIFPSTRYVRYILLFVFTHCDSCWHSCSCNESQRVLLFLDEIFLSCQCWALDDLEKLFEGQTSETTRGFRWWRIWYFREVLEEIQLIFRLLWWNGGLLMLRWFGMMRSFAGVVHFYFQQGYIIICSSL
jgi:hypothetical protein